MAFDLTQLRTFRTVAETSSFTRAAARLYVTQSAVSHQIKALEEELGEALFIRTRHGVRLAEAGQAVLEHVDRIFEEVEALRRRLGHDGDQPVGRVRAAAATQALVHLFAPHFRAFMEAYPRVEVVFRSTVSTDRTVGDILAGVADVGLRVEAGLLGHAAGHGAVRGRAAARRLARAPPGRQWSLRR